MPWTAADCRRAGTVHLGGTLEEIAASEAEVAAGREPERPYVIVAQQSLFDPGRAPAGQAHALGLLPRAQRLTGRHGGADRGPDRALRARVPGASSPRAGPWGRPTWSAHNPNYVGGDINGGMQDLRQLFTRPAVRPVPYATPDPRIFICSSSTPPGGGRPRHVRLLGPRGPPCAAPSERPGAARRPPQRGTSCVQMLST